MRCCGEKTDGQKSSADLTFYRRFCTTPSHGYHKDKTIEIKRKQGGIIRIHEALGQGIQVHPSRQGATSRRNYRMILVSLAVLTITAGRLTIGLRIPYKHLPALNALVRPRKSVN